MERWALVSGLQGDLDLYEQIQKELKQQRGVANLFLLGDLIGSQRNCNALLERLRQPKRCLLYTSPSPRDLSTSRMPSSA